MGKVFLKQENSPAKAQKLRKFSFLYSEKSRYMLFARGRKCEML